VSRKVTEIVEELAAPLLAEDGLELVDIEFKKEGKNLFCACSSIGSKAG